MSVGLDRAIRGAVRRLKRRFAPRRDREGPSALVLLYHRASTSW